MTKAPMPTLVLLSAATLLAEAGVVAMAMLEAALATPVTAWTNLKVA